MSNLNSSKVCRKCSGIKADRFFLTIHVDDIYLVCAEQGSDQFRSITVNLTMKMEGPYKPKSGDVLYYLKKRWTLLEQGVFVQPNPSYVHKLCELLELKKKKRKTLPHHANLEVFDKANADEDEFLSEVDERKPRSG